MQANNRARRWQYWHHMCRCVALELKSAVTHKVLKQLLCFPAEVVVLRNTILGCWWPGIKGQAVSAVAAPIGSRASCCW
jgi:hypothetical protein